MSKQQGQEGKVEPLHAVREMGAFTESRIMMHGVWTSCLGTLKIPSLKLLKARKKTKCFPSQNTFYLAVF